jgi:hypothetical protein
VCAFANTNGGTIYIGLLEDPKQPVVGVTEPEQSIAQLEKEISSRISPPLICTVDVQETGGKKILRVLVPRGDDPPYAVDDNKIYVRSEAETSLAVRDEIVGLVLRSSRLPVQQHEPSEGFSEPADRVFPELTRAPAGRSSAPAMQTAEASAPVLEAVAEVDEGAAPRTGVEVVSAEERNGARYYTMRDLRNGNVVKNVTRTSARRLWHYAITSYAQLPEDLSQANVQWQGSIGLIRRYKQGKDTRYDLVQHTPDGYRYYFGVTDDGIHGPWLALVGQEEE